MLNINPVLLLREPTHLFKGLKVKVLIEHETCFVVEIMEGPDARKWSTAEKDELKTLV